ncbi:hypothetical protein [Dinghuibacter silviterrae]|uniref:Uncharacterized protein n=1 Tax=Dinghuibacter silviterrae TaxID=1539049 RepID=A0A4R8DT86_9BACT|nr:hypothetical protein [Dinghuibacter silviterrae]TDX01494.1 hypothetical protein EDB95_2530 [Dinghuibacter silviterrae]
MAKIKLINPEREPLTVEKLRQLTGWQDISDEQATAIIHSVDLFVRILYDVVAKEYSHCIDNQYLINLEDNSEPLNNAA